MQGLKVFFAVLMSLTAQAASAQDWGGSYYGLSLGYVSGTSNHSWVGTPDGVDVDVKGGTLSARYGNNFVNGGIVFGYEVGLGLSNADGFVLGGITPCITPGEACNSSLDAYATLKGRVAVPLENGVLPYFSAGLALGKISATADTGACSGTPCSIDKVLTGYTVGLGIEKAMQNGWNLNLDYSYMGFSKRGLDGGSFGNVRTGFDYNILSVGFSRRF